MTRSELLRTIEHYGLAPNRKFGQNFLIDGNLLEFIVRTAAPAPGEHILEIGPGLGILTRALLAKGTRVSAVEIDRGLCAYLKETIQNENFRLIEGDACRVDLESLFPARIRFRCISNLPYAISSPFVARLLEMENPPMDMLLMLQKETAERLAAGPRSPLYSSLSVQTAFVYDVHLVRTVSRRVFFPVPEVDSALVRFNLRCPAATRSERCFFNQVVRLAFTQRRKKMISSLSRKYQKEECLEAFQALAISPDSRAEELTVQQFARLAEKLANLN